jgi:hypothetical protein
LFFLIGLTLVFIIIQVFDFFSTNENRKPGLALTVLAWLITALNLVLINFSFKGHNCSRLGIWVIYVRCLLWIFFRGTDIIALSSNEEDLWFHYRVTFTATYLCIMIS